MSTLLSVNELEMGMILERDVLDPNTGTTLIGNSMAITKSLIQSLVNNGIGEVFIKAEDIPIKKYNAPLMEKYSKVEEKLNHLFIKVKDGKKIAAAGIVSDMKDFIEEVKAERDILTQMRLLKKKDDYTFNHSLGVSTLAISLGKWLNYSSEEVEELAIAGLFHDIGKLKISDEIINKPANLTEEEFNIMKKHPFYSYQMLAECEKFSDDILLGVLQHHEKMNGTGYPNRVTGDRIHKYAKVIAVCDIFHALTSRRVYRDRENPLTVAEYLRKESFTNLDPHIVQVFLKKVSRFYVGNKVVLSNGQIGSTFIDFLTTKDIEVVDIII